MNVREAKTSDSELSDGKLSPHLMYYCPVEFL